ncbi:MAG: hypothetical protein AAGM67_01060 [Bacteroidota bacterium]
MYDRFFVPGFAERFYPSLTYQPTYQLNMYRYQRLYDPSYWKMIAALVGAMLGLLLLLGLG